MQLKAPNGSTLEPPVNTNYRDTYYRPLTAQKLGLKYLNKDIIIYYPQDKTIPTNTKKLEFDPESCKDLLVQYLANAIAFATNQQSTSNLDIDNNNVRTRIQGCSGSGMYQNLSVNKTDLSKYVQLSDKRTPFKWYRKGETLDLDNIKSILTDKDFKKLRPGNSYLPFYIKESELKLKNIIKENLTKIKKEKDSSLLIESKIIQTRTKILTENRILKFKQPREKFFNEIISESLYLESQGFDKQLIKEEFWDAIKGLFGQHGSEAIFGTFKEYMGKWLLQKLTPVNPDGWMGSIIVTAIGNLHFDDLSKLTDCNFITKKLASSIGEGIARKIQHDKGYDGGISDIVRNGLFSAIDNTQMVQSLETGLAKLVCPALTGVKSKIEDKANKMKTMAVQA